MIPISHAIKDANSLRQALQHSPVLMLLVVLVIVQAISFLPRQNVEKAYAAQTAEFKEVWNSGGSMALAAQGITPSVDEEESRRKAYVKQFVDKSFYFQLQMVPAWLNPVSFFTSWVFQPGWFSLLLSLWVLIYAGLWLEKAWNKRMPILAFMGVSILSTGIYYILYMALAGNHSELAYVGVSAVTGMAVGLLARAHRGMIPVWMPGSKDRFELHPWIFAGIWFFADFAVQLFINPVNYGWGFFIDVIALIAGIWMAPRLPLQINGRR